MVPGIVAWWLGVYVSLTYLVIWPDWEAVHRAHLWYSARTKHLHIPFPLSLLFSPQTCWFPLGLPSKFSLYCFQPTPQLWHACPPCSLELSLPLYDWRAAAGISLLGTVPPSCLTLLPAAPVPPGHSFCSRKENSGSEGNWFA